MSLQLQGLLSAVPLADGGVYIDENGLTKNAPRSGRKCRGMMFDLLLGTRSGGILCQQSLQFGGIVYQENKTDNVEALTLDGLINFGALYSALLARLSNGVILRLSSRLGLYRPDELYSCIGTEVDTGFFKIDCPAYKRVIDDNEVMVTPHIKSDFTLKLPFIGNVSSFYPELLMSYDDKMVFPSRASQPSIDVHYSLGYLKFENEQKNSVVGVLCNHFAKTYITRNDLVFPINLINNDGVSGVLVNNSSNFSNRDLVISEKYQSNFS